MPSVLYSSKLSKNLKDDLFSEIEEMVKGSSHMTNKSYNSNANTSNHNSPANNNKITTPHIDTINREVLHSMMDINRAAAMGVDFNYIHNVEVRSVLIYYC